MKQEIFACYAQKEVVEEVEDKILQISLEDAKRNINPYFIIGDIIDIEVTPKNFGRISSTNCKTSGSTKV